MKEVNFPFYLILVNLHLKSCVCLGCYHTGECGSRTLVLRLEGRTTWRISKAPTPGFHWFRAKPE